MKGLDGHLKVAAFVRQWILGLVLVLSISTQADAQDRRDPSLVYERARKAMQARDYGAAAESWRSLIELLPDMPEARSNLGLVYHLQEKYDLAVDQFREALQQNPNLLAAKVFLGIDYYLTSRPDRAIEELEGARALDQNNVLARKWLALSYDQVGRYAAAISELTACRLLAPDDHELVFHLGRAFQKVATEAFLSVRKSGLDSPWLYFLRGKEFARQGDTRRVLDELSHAARLDPGLPGLHHEIASALEREGRIREAVHEYAAELRNFPSHLASAAGLFRTLRGVGLEQYADSVRTNALELHGGTARATGAFSLVASRAGQSLRIGTDDAARIGESLPTFEISGERRWQARALDAILAGRPRMVFALTAGPEARLEPDDAQYWDARAYLAMAGLDEAVERFMLLLSRQPENVEAAFFLHSCAQELALEALDLFASLEPGSYRTHQLRAEYHAAAENYDQALEEYGRALALAPGAPQLHLAVGSLYLGRKEFEKALGSFQSELNNDPYSVQALSRMGEVLLVLGSDSRAEEVLQRAISINPGFAMSHKALGRVYFKRRDYDAAVEHLQAALRLGVRDDEDLHYHLGRAQRMLGNLEEAERSLSIVTRLKAARQAVAQERLESSIDVPPETPGGLPLR